MDKAIDSLSGAIEKIYQSFVLRDLLGFVLPGFVFLLSLWYLIGEPSQIPVCEKVSDKLKCLMIIAHVTPNLVEAIVFLGVSYLTAWILQSVHYGFVDWIIYSLIEFLNWIAEQTKNKEWSYLVRRLLQFLFWPFIRIFFYANKIAHPNNLDGKATTSASLQPSLIIRGALKPDRKLERIKQKEFSTGISKILNYNERLSVLMIMTGNVAIASIPFFFFILPNWSKWFITLLGWLMWLMIYLEYWRLWYARNLQIAEIDTDNTQE